MPRATARVRHVRRTACTARSLQTACLARGLRSDRSAAAARAQPVRTVGEAPYETVLGDRSAAAARAQLVHRVRKEKPNKSAQSYAAAVYVSSRHIAFSLLSRYLIT